MVLGSAWLPGRRVFKFKNNLLAQFSVVTFVIMVIMALVISVVLIETLNRNVDLMKEHEAALVAGETIRPSDPISITSLSRQVSNLKWITLVGIGGSFIYLYATLVGMVWEGWRTIVRQQSQLRSANAELERRVAERVEKHREALEEGRRRLDAFRTVAGRLALEEVPERGLQDLVHVSRDLVGARYGVLALLNPVGPVGKLLTSGFSPDQQVRIGPLTSGISELGIQREGARKVVIGDKDRLLSAHGFPPTAAPVKSFLGVAVMALGRTAGAFYLIDKEDDTKFTEDDEELLNLFAVLAGVHFENVGLFEEVAQERRKLAAIQGSMTEGLIVLDSAGQVTYLNETAERLWWLNPIYTQGKHIKDVFGAKASDFETPEALSGLLNIAENHDYSTARVEVTVTRPQRRHLEVTAFAIPGAPGHNMTGLLARDITEQIELQERRNAFVSIASHELRTPMTTIMGFSELPLNDELPEASRREWAEKIHRNSKVLSAIVDDMLNVSRIQSGKLQLDLGHLELYSVVDEVVAVIRPETNVHEFLIEIPADTPLVVADREKLDQVLINLFTNAVKYSPEGGPITISARYEQEHDRVVVEVADKGIGIAPEDRVQLFSTFHRISRPETQDIRGTGLGLSIVNGLVRMMRGEVWVESSLDEGSRFSFSLPTLRVEMAEGTWHAAVEPARSL